MSDFDLVLNARYFVNPESFDVMQDQQVCIRSGMIADIQPLSKGTTGEEVNEYGDAVILPAFVNCHTHLDLSHLRGMPLSGENFGAWLAAVVEARSAGIGTITEGTLKAVNEMLGTGTAAVLDILATNPGAVDVARVIFESGLRAAVAVEVLCFDEDTEEQSLQTTLGLAQRVLDVMLEVLDEDLACMVERFHEGDQLPQTCISPHAPYTISPKLYGLIADYTQRHLMLQTTHLSESPAERDFLANHSGDLHALFKQIGVNVDKIRWGRGTPVETWLEATRGRIQRGVNDCVLVHCYDLTDAEVEALGKAGATIAYCPRSRTFFGHPEFRFKDLIDAGCRIVIGTDSLGSNQNLDLLQELAQARREQPEVSAKSLFKAATMEGRRAIQLRPSSWERAHRIADLQVIAAPEGANRNNLLEELIAQRPEQLATIIDGEYKFHRA